MKKTTKKIFIGFISAFIAIIMSFSVYAALPENEIVSPMWDNIGLIELDIFFTGTTSTATGVAMKKSTASFIEGSLYLYELIDGDWIIVDSTYNSATQGTLAANIEFYPTPYVTYMAVFEVTAYTNGVGETKTVDYTETYIPQN